MNTNQTASTALSIPVSFTPEKKQELFEEIVRLYDLVDDALAVTQHPDVVNRDIQVELLTPFVTQVTNSTNILSAFYNEVVNKGLPITEQVQETYESAFRNIFYAYKDFIDGAEMKFQVKAG